VLRRTAAGCSAPNRAPSAQPGAPSERARVNERPVLWILRLSQSKTPSPSKLVSRPRWGTLLCPNLMLATWGTIRFCRPIIRQNFCVVNSFSQRFVMESRILVPVYLLPVCLAVFLDNRDSYGQTISRNSSLEMHIEANTRLSEPCHVGAAGLLAVMRGQHQPPPGSRRAGTAWGLAWVSGVE
jgi:hypothetical protein